MSTEPTAELQDAERYRFLTKHLVVLYSHDHSRYPDMNLLTIVGHVMHKGAGRELTVDELIDALIQETRL